MSATTPASTPRPDRTAGLAPVSLCASRRLARAHTGLLLTLAALALWGLWPLTPLPALAVTIAFWGLLCWARVRFVRWQRAHPAALMCESGRWYLLWSGRCEEVRPAGEWLAWPALVVLPLARVDAGRPITLVCLPDSASQDGLRRLRTWLRLGGASLY